MTWVYHGRLCPTNIFFDRVNDSIEKKDQLPLIALEFSKRVGALQWKKIFWLKWSFLKNCKRWVWGGHEELKKWKQQISMLKKVLYSWIQVTSGLPWGSSVRLILVNIFISGLDTKRVRDCLLMTKSWEALLSQVTPANIVEGNGMIGTKHSANKWQFGYVGAKKNSYSWRYQRSPPRKRC